MRRAIFNGLVGVAFLGAAWRWLTGRTQPIHVGGRVATWVYGDGRRDDTRYVQKAVDIGGLIELPPAIMASRGISIPLDTVVRGA